MNIHESTTNSGNGDAVRRPGDVEDLDIVRELRRRGHAVRVLVVGPADAARCLLESLRGELGQPVHECRSADPLPSDRLAGTAIVTDVDTYDTARQAALLEWLTGNEARSSVIALASTPLWPAVERGAFNADLFYRLNTITLSVG